MKTRIIFEVVLVTAFLFASTTFAEGSKNKTEANTYGTIELNRIIGLASDNDGLKISCAFNLGEMKSQKAVLPLIAMLRDGKTDEERIIAALSLMKIGGEQAVYMVGRAAKFNDNSRVRYICEKFYNGYLIEKYQSEKSGNNTVAKL